MNPGTSAITRPSPYPARRMKWLLIGCVCGRLFTALGQTYEEHAVAAVLMGYHQWLARGRKPAGCFEAFLHNHYIGLIVFIGIVLHYTFNPGPQLGG